MYRRAFVGREAELRQLQHAFDAATSGQGSLAMVVGEPGIGKTSLCEQIGTYAAIRGSKTLVGHCYGEGALSLPYLPFVEAMRSYVLAREPEGLESDLGSGAGEVARIVSEVRDRVQVTPAETGDADEQRWRLLQAVSGFLRSAGSVQPLLIVLEDLHDADRGTLNLLVHLSRNLEGARLLLVGTYRDVEVDRSHPLSSALAELRRGSNFQRVPLRGLTAEEVQRMMASVSQREIPWPLAELVYRQTEGNPLFVQEMLRYLVEEGLVAEQGGSLRRVGDDSLAGRIPEGLRDVIGKRLSRLADKTNEVLAIAAVIGREFRLDVLQAVANLPQDEVEAALEEAANVAVVEQRTAVGGQLSFRFMHAFFRQTLYEELFAAKRIRLHQQVARALEAVYGRRVDEHAAELAEHYSNSSNPADLSKAVAYGEIAAERAMAVFAYGEAARHLEQALKAQDVLDPDNKLKRCDLLLSLASAFLPSEEPLRVSESIAPAALALAETLGDTTRAGRAALLALEAFTRNSALGWLPRSAEFAAWADRADLYAREGSPERVQTDVYLGISLLGRQGPAAGHVYLRRAGEAALRGDDSATFFMAAGWVLRHLLAVQDHEMRDAIADEVVRRRRDGARSVDLGVCLLYVGHILLERGDRGSAERVWLELSELAATARDATIAALAGEFPPALAFCDGRFDDVVALREERQADGILSSDVRGLLQLAKSLIARGRPEAAETVTREGRNRPLLAARALVLAYLGRHDEAAAIIREFANLGSPEDRSGLHVVVCSFEAAILGGDTETTRALSARLAPLAAVIAYQTSFARLLGSAATLLGEQAQARDYYQQALDACEKIGFRPEMALIRLQLAELLLARYPDEHAAAVEHLDFSISEFREMKMQPSLERALRHKEMLSA